jgi:protein transport protein SEC23
VLPYEPVPCKQCGAVLNPYVQTDFYTKVWVCPFCHTRNHFPPHYQGITDQNLPAELYPNFTTIEYTLNRTVPAHPPVYVFVIDTCVAEDELQACKQAVMQALQMIPEYVHVGLVTFGTHVHVHELGFTECSKSYVFRGSKEYSTTQVIDQLGLGRTAQRPGAQAAAPAAPAKRFIMPLGECDFTINSVLEELQRDAYPVVSSHRPGRCTGTALQVRACRGAAAVWWLQVGGGLGSIPQQGASRPHVAAPHVPPQTA